MLSQDADEEDALQSLKFRVSSGSVQALKEILIRDFGGLVARDIRSHTLLVGPYGIDGFVTNVVDEVLDTLPLGHPNYRAFMELLGAFCGELGQKLSNFRKVCQHLQIASILLRAC